MARGGPSLLVAFICTKALLPVRAPLTVAITPPIARYWFHPLYQMQCHVSSQLRSACHNTSIISYLKAMHMMPLMKHGREHGIKHAGPAIRFRAIEEASIKWPAFHMQISLQMPKKACHMFTPCSKAFRSRYHMFSQHMLDPDLQCSTAGPEASRSLSA